ARADRMAAVTRPADTTHAAVAGRLFIAPPTPVPPDRVIIARASSPGLYHLPHAHPSCRRTPGRGRSRRGRGSRPGRGLAEGDPGRRPLPGRRPPGGTPRRGPGPSRRRPVRGREDGGAGPAPGRRRRLLP